MTIFDEKTPSSTPSKNKKVENDFVKKLEKHLNMKEVQLDDGTMVSNMDAIIDNMIGRALDGDTAVIKLIRDLLQSKN